MKLDRILHHVFLSLLILLSLAACQQATSSMKAQFQQTAKQSIVTYASTISKMQVAPGSAVRGLSENVALGWGNGSYNPYSGTPYGGYYQYQDPSTTSSQCMQLAQMVPRDPAYFQTMLAVVAKCATVTMANQNPIMTYASQNLDSTSQDLLGYSAYNALQVGPYGAYNATPGTYSTLYNSSMLNGISTTIPYSNLAN